MYCNSFGLSTLEQFKAQRFKVEKNGDVLIERNVISLYTNISEFYFQRKHKIEKEKCVHFINKQMWRESYETIFKEICRR